MSKKPLVSILIASYNKERYVRRCIQSCLSQSYKKIEIIFYDDGSNDNSFKIAKTYKKIKVFKNYRKKKLSYFNTYPQINSYMNAFKKSKGKIISFLDSDDFYKKDKISEIVKHFTKYKKSRVVFNKPIYYYSKKKYKILPNNFFNKTNKNIWPKFPQQSCISIKRDFLEKYKKIIYIKNFSMLTLDFRIAVIANTLLNDYFLLEKNLTYYFQDDKGEASKFKKFGVNWWKRRNQAHSFMKLILKRHGYNHNMNLDYIFTKIINFFIKLLF